MSEAAGRDFHRRWPMLQPPLRPPPEVIAAVARLIEGRGGLALVLGVTPEIAFLPERSIALDWDERMVRIAAVPRDRHRAVVADWMAPPLGPVSVATVIGDASLNILHWPPRRLWTALAGILAPGARIVLRCFTAPEEAQPIERLRDEALAGRAGSFPAFKLRFNMGVSGALGRCTITCGEIFDAFEACFPDRAALIAATGWSVDAVEQIDLYAANESILTYPSRSQFFAELPWPARFVEVGGYAGAEFCPLLLVDLPG